MYTVSAEFSAAVIVSHQRAARIVTLTPDLREVDVFEADDAVLLGGSATCDRTRDQRRTMTAEIINPAGLYSPIDLDSTFGLLRLVRIDRGIVLPTGTEWVPLGVYVLEEPEVELMPGGSTVRFAGTDRSKLAADARFGRPLTFGATQRVQDVVRALAELSGMGTDDALFDLNDGSALLGTLASWEEETPLVEAMLTLARDHALDLAPTAEGILRLAPLAPPDEATPVWTFEAGTAAIMEGITRRQSAASLFNHVVVVGEGAAAGPFRGEARDLNPASSTYNPADGSGPIGDRLAPIYRSSLITSAAQAQARADAMLREVALISEQVTVPSAPHPALEAGDVVEIFEATSATAGRFVLDSVDIPIGGGAMSLSAKRVRSLA